MLENFIYSETKDLFLIDLGAGRIPEDAIVFIEDTREIYTHGAYYDGSKIDLNNLEESLKNFVIENLNKTVQTIDLVKGFTWVSFYVRTSLEEVQKALGDKGVSIKTGNDGTTNTNLFSVYDPSTGFWEQNFPEFDFSLMYQIEVLEPFTIKLVGELLNPKDFLITLNPGSNYISYPSNQILDCKDALMNIPEPQEGDIFKSSSSFLEFAFGTWQGASWPLSPGQGYIYKSNSDSIKKFYFPTESDFTLKKAKEYTDFKISTSQDFVTKELSKKQDTLKSGETIKTVNGQSLLGSGDIKVATINYDLNVKAINHRGHSIDTPENTIPAYIRSKEAGFTYVEADVAFTSDNVAVLLHDSTIDRTSNGSGSIKNLTYEKVLQYDFGSWFSSEFEGVKIPTFKEFIVLCKRLGLHPYIELKSSDTYTQSQISQIVKEVEDCGMKGKVTYISFNNTFLGYVKNADDTARLGYLITTISSTYINNAIALRSGKNEVFIDAKLANLNESRINSCITNDFPLEVWTVNTEQEILNMSSYVSGVTSDNLVAGKVLYEAALTYIPPVSSFVPTNAITLSQNSLEFTNKEAFTLVATLDPSNASDPVVWKSSNTAVATVNNGVVTPLADGTCNITATSDGKSASCSVNVAFAKYSVDSTLSGCSLSNPAQTITIGDSYITEVIPDTGYSLKNAQIRITLNGEDITPLCYSNGMITIENVTGNIRINVTCIEVPVYTITRELTGCTSNKDTTSIGEGNPYTEQFTLLEGFRFDGAAVLITMGGKDITDSSYKDGVLNILEVTGNIIIHIAAEAIPVYSIVRNLVNCTSDKTTTSVYDGASYTEAIIANDGYTLRGGNISITMGGKDITPFLSNSGVLSIDLVTGDIVINVEAVEYNAALPIVDLDLANVGADGVIKNLGTGGSTYDTTIQTTSTSDTFTVSSGGLTLKNHAYANIPYALKSTDKFTIICKGKIATKSSKTYQRFFRTDTDAPSWYYSKSNTKLQAKLSGKNSSESTISILGSLISSLTGTNNSGNSVVFNTDTTSLREVMFTCDGTDIKLYIDGKISASQPASGLAETTYIGIGDNNPSTSYYASALEISRFTIYDSVITEGIIADEPVNIRLTSENLSQGAISSKNESTGSYELISPYRTNMLTRASTAADLSILVNGGKTISVEAKDKSGAAMQVGIQTFNDDALEALSKQESVYPYLIDSGWVSSGSSYQIPITHKYAWLVVSYPNTSTNVDVNNIDYIQITELT